ncbi:LOW QUALITY PROTEIN: bone marrow stromal antigen 2, partial [Physeter macrocephalus]|uniref:LOW QUALITY PROTEIN: bone marrow stromal antigen 2 n=1 Tax=Physeter macrocephalus TaxID=9755 RepID=A0A455ASG8_PHYMC
VAPAQRRFQLPPLTPVQTPYEQIWRALTFYHYSPGPTFDHLNESVLRRCVAPRYLCFLLLLVMVMVMALLVPLIIFVVRANSKDCTDGLQAEQECQNLTRYVQHQLTQAQEVLHEMEVQAATCNQTVVTLRDSLKMEQAQVAELQGEVKILKQKLEDTLAEVQRLRRGSEASAENNSSSCLSVLFAVVVVVVLKALLI